MKKDSGFIQIIVLIIVFVVIAYYLGKDPLEIWEKVKPIFEFVLDLFIKAIGFLIKITTQIWETARQ